MGPHAGFQENRAPMVGVIAKHRAAVGNIQHADSVPADLLDGAAHLRYSKEMTLHVQTLSGLVDDLFELSRLAAGDIEWTMRQVHLDELVLETVDAMRTQADAGGIDVSAVVPADLGRAGRYGRVLHQGAKGGLHRSGTGSSLCRPRGGRLRQGRRSGIPGSPAAPT